MKYVLSNGVEMPVLGLGTFLIKNDDAYQVVLDALSLGYRHIDTAQMYGNESAIGKAIKDSKIPREEIFITTKLDARKLGYQSAIDELKISLEKLGTSYVDLYLIHWPSPSDLLNIETWHAFETIYEQKLARAIGVSNFKIHHMDAILHACKVKPMADQVELHPGLYQLPLDAYLKKNNIQTISYGPFMKGEVFNVDGPYQAKLQMVANKYHATVAQIVIAWGLKRKIVMIPKTTHKERLIENLKALSLKLSDEDLLEINGLNRGKRVYTDPDNNSFVKQS